MGRVHFIQLQIFVEGDFAPADGGRRWVHRWGCLTLPRSAGLRPGILTETFETGRAGAGAPHSLPNIVATPNSSAPMVGYGSNRSPEGGGKTGLGARSAVPPVVSPGVPGTDSRMTGVDGTPSTTGAGC